MKENLSTISRHYKISRIDNSIAHLLSGDVSTLNSVKLCINYVKYVSTKLFMSATYDRVNTCLHKNLNCHTFFCVCIFFTGCGILSSARKGNFTFQSTSTRIAMETSLFLFGVRCVAVGCHILGDVSHSKWQCILFQ